MARVFYVYFVLTTASCRIKVYISALKQHNFYLKKSNKENTTLSLGVGPF